MEAWHTTPQVLPASEERPPVLVAHGAVDQVIPAANAGLLAERWDGARRSSRAAATRLLPRSPNAWRI